MTNFLRLNVGYTFLAWSNVVRPGDQIDRVANISQIPPPVGPGTLMGPANPAFNFKDSFFWAQGINFARNCGFRRAAECLHPSLLVGERGWSKARMLCCAPTLAIAPALPRSVLLY